LQGPQMASPGQLMQMGSNFALANAQNQFQASQAGSPLAMISGLTGGIANLGSAYGRGGFNLGG
jgi:hypothetical protein